VRSISALLMAVGLVVAVACSMLAINVLGAGRDLQALYWVALVFAALKFLSQLARAGSIG
jgi:hypothetical protein